MRVLHLFLDKISYDGGIASGLLWLGESIGGNEHGRYIRHVPQAQPADTQSNKRSDEGRVLGAIISQTGRQERGDEVWEFGTQTSVTTWSRAWPSSGVTTWAVASSTRAGTNTTDGCRSAAIPFRQHSKLLGAVRYFPIFYRPTI